MLFDRDPSLSTRPVLLLNLGARVPADGTEQILRKVPVLFKVCGRRKEYRRTRGSVAANGYRHQSPRSAQGTPPLEIEGVSGVGKHDVHRVATIGHDDSPVLL